MTALPILLFHALDERPSALSFSPIIFRRFMAELHGRGRRTLSLPEAVARLRAGEAFSPSEFVVTFDDGYRSVYTEAFPVLQEFGFSATLFVAVGNEAPRGATTRLPPMQDRPMVSWGEMDEMRRGGVEIGAHTLTHPDLTRLTPGAAEDEIRRSQRIIEEALGTPARCFAYPYGNHNPRCRDIVQRYYDCACSTRLGLVGSGSDPFALERVETYYLRTGRSVALMHSPIFDLYLRARRMPRLIRQTLAWGRA